MPLLNSPSFRFLSWLTGLIILVWGSGWVCAKISKKLDHNEPKVDQVFALRDQANDVIYIGNSIAHQAINPRVVEEHTGLSGYNLAIGGSSFLENTFLLDTYLSHNQKPKLVLLGVAINCASVGETIRPSVYLSLTAARRQQYRELAAGLGIEIRTSDQILMRLPVYRHRSSLERLVKYFAQGKERIPEYVDGHLALTLSAPLPKVHRQHPSEMNESSLRIFLNYCERESLPVLVVEIPCSPPFNASTVNREQTLARMNSTIATYPDVRFLSLNTPNEIGLDDTDWVTIDHLNATGAKKFSEKLAMVVSDHWTTHHARSNNRVVQLP